MINRLKDLLGEPEEERPPASEFFVVAAKYEVFYVSRETAERLLAELAAGEDPPRWVCFTDIYGSRISLRGGLIEYVRECTEAQRAAEREFHRARRRERKADRSWDDDDWF